MASKETWDKLKHFKPTENWGDADAISDLLLLTLDDFRDYIGVPIIVSNAVATSGHSSKSYHYRSQGACAVDVMLPEYRGGVIDLLFDVFRFGFSGVGYYPDWSYNANVVGGLHLDVRPLKWGNDKTLDYKQARWMGVNENGKQVYKPLILENIKKYGGI